MGSDIFIRLEKMNEISSNGFFLLRSPLLPYNTLKNLGEEKLKVLAKENMLFREAIFLSSSDFYDRMIEWTLGKTNSTDTLKILDTLKKYVLRMSYRCTPFGTSAGISLGNILQNTVFKTEKTFTDRRYCRLDMTFISAYINWLLKDGGINEHLQFFSNNTIYKLDDGLRYVEYVQKESSRTHELVGLDSNEFIMKIIDISKHGTDYLSLCNSLIEPGIDYDQAREYIDELINIKLLISELELSPEGEDEIEKLCSVLESASHTHAAIFRTIRDLMATINGSILSAIDGVEIYKEVITQIEKLGLNFDKRFLIQVDLFRDTDQLRLGEVVIDELFASQKFLESIKSKAERSELDRFISAFQNRYEYSEIPLLEVLDPEAGLGYPFRDGQASDNSILTKGITGQNITTDPKFIWTAWQRLILDRYNQAMKRGDYKINFTSADSKENKSRLKRPSSAYTVCKLFAQSSAAIDQGEFKLLHVLTSGPSSVDLISRFCYMDQQLTSVTKNSLKKMSPDEKIEYAEILHINQPRAGNISKHPAFYNYQIPIVANASSKEKSIPLDDLMVSVLAGEIILRSKRLNKRIIPRLSTAHNYTQNTISYYHFLCDLQYQGVSGDLYWDWGTLVNMPFLPRIEYGKVILSRACWNIEKEELQLLKSLLKEDNIKNLEKFLSKRGIPQHITIREADYELPIDLLNPLSLDVLLRLTSKKSSVKLEENIFEKEGMILSQEQENYTNDLVIPFSVSTKNEYIKLSPPQKKITQKTFAPGDEWLYTKVYCSTKMANKLLVDIILPLANSLLEKQMITKWFFIRYNDPSYHIRLRFLIKNDNLGNVLKELHSILKRYIDTGKISTMQIDTYNRELERYPLINYELTESLFFFDSELVIGFLQEKKETSMFALEGVDRFLDDFGLDLLQKIELTNYWQSAFKMEFRVEKANIEAFKNKYRSLREDIEHCFSKSSREKYNSLFEIRSAHTKMLAQAMAEESKEQVLSQLNSYIHMFLNRLFSVNPRKNEMVVYDLLHQYYKAKWSKEKYLSAKIN